MPSAAAWQQLRTKTRRRFRASQAVSKSATLGNHGKSASVCRRTYILPEENHEKQNSFHVNHFDWFVMGRHMPTQLRLDPANANPMKRSLRQWQSERISIFLQSSVDTPWHHDTTAYKLVFIIEYLISILSSEQLPILKGLGLQLSFKCRGTLLGLIGLVMHGEIWWRSPRNLTTAHWNLLMRVDNHGYFLWGVNRLRASAHNIQLIQLAGSVPLGRESGSWYVQFLSRQTLVHAWHDKATNGTCPRVEDGRSM